MIKSLKKYILIILGTISLALGFVGVFLPILPTTPFLLLSSVCYMHSSKSLYEWLIHQRVIGAYIYNYVTNRAVLKSTRVFSLIFLWVALIASMLIGNSWQLSVFLTLVGIGVSIHLLTLKTIKKFELIDLDSRENSK